MVENREVQESIQRNRLARQSGTVGERKKVDMSKTISKKEGEWMKSGDVAGPDDITVEDGDV